MSKRFLSGINVTGTATLNTVADAGSNTGKFLVLDSSNNVSYRTAAELYADLGIGVTPAAYTSTLKHEVKASQTISKGQAVYVSSADGTNMIVSKASNVSEGTSSKTMGLLETSLTTNGKGNVITEGLLSGLNTSSAVAGDPVWLGVDGALIYGLTNKPYAPAHLVFIGIVTRVNSNNGEIFVKVQNGFEMNELHDYQQGSVQNNEVIVYESATSLYKPKSIPTILGYTPVPDSRTLTINGTTYDLTANRAWTITTDASARSILRYVATANQTTFTISGGYTPGLTDVYRNGVKLDNSTDFTATNGTTIVLTNGASVNDVIEVYRYQTAFLANNALRTVTEFIATAGQTTFNVTYNSGLVDVFYNGSKLLSTEYAAGNGTTIVLNFPCNLNDTLEVHAYSYAVGAFTGQAQLNGTGFVKANGTTITYDNSTYLTSINSSQVTTALGYTPYNSTNPSGYITSSALSTYLPLTGGTLTGALSGTSATFSGNVGIGTSPSFPLDLLTSSSGTFNTIVQFQNTDFTSGNRSFLRMRQWINSGGSSSSYFGTGQDGNLYIIANNSARGGDLIINAGTGAATFSNSVGIGGTPQERLSIYGSSSLAGMIRWTDSTTGSAFLGITSGGTAYIHSNNNALAFGANGSNNFAATITLTNGNVGVGISNPSFPLDFGTGGTGNHIRARRIYAAGTGTDTGFSLNGILIYQGPGGEFNITNPGSYPNIAFTINNSGNVGIGTTGPAATLTVYKTRIGSFTTQSPNQLYLQSQGYDGSGYNTIDFGSTSYGVPLARIGVGIFGDGTYMSFGTSNSYATGITNVAMTINPSGNVGIGSGNNGSPNNRLLVQGGNIAKGTTFGFDGAVDNMIKFGAQQDINASGQFLDRWLGIDCTVTAGAGSSNIMYFKVYSGGGSGSPRTVAFFNGDGGVFNFNNSTNWQQVSDVKIKDNIRPINNALEKLCALNPSHFEYKNNLGKTKTGFIAQEFEQVFAGHVTENVPSGDFKKYFKQGEMMKSIDADLIPYLVKAIQELTEKVNALENK
jgi:hypothetical protein